MLRSDLKAAIAPAAIKPNEDHREDRRCHRVGTLESRALGGTTESESGLTSASRTKYAWVERGLLMHFWRGSYETRVKPADVWWPCDIEVIGEFGEPRISVDKDRIEELVQERHRPCLLFRRWERAHDVTYAAHDERIEGFRFADERNELRRESMATKGEKLHDEDVGADGVERVQQYILTNGPLLAHPILVVVHLCSRSLRPPVPIAA
jgi:hypothetical protein